MSPYYEGFYKDLKRMTIYIRQNIRQDIGQKIELFTIEIIMVNIEKLKLSTYEKMTTSKYNEGQKVILFFTKTFVRKIIHKSKQGLIEISTEPSSLLSYRKEKRGLLIVRKLLTNKILLFNDDLIGTIITLTKL